MAGKKKIVKKSAPVARKPVGKKVPTLKIGKGFAPATLNHVPEETRPAIYHGGTPIRAIDGAFTPSEMNRKIAAITKKSGFAPTKYQITVFDFIALGTGHGIVKAVAGSGKTTTLMQALDFIHHTKSVLMCAFNKHIADELNMKGLPDNVQAMTLHSFGIKTLNAAVRGFKKVNTDKTMDCLWYGVYDQPARDSEQNKEYLAIRNPVCRIVSLLKAHAVGCTSVKGAPPLNADTIIDLATKYGVDLPQDVYRFNDVVIDAFNRCNKRTDVIDYDDMLFIPLFLDLPVPKYDFVFVDESQDLNICQIELVRRAAKRAVFVGDEFQAIYGFRGANPEAIDFIRSHFSATELPLSICWRCPKSVIAEAQQIIPHIEAAPNAKDGIVRRIKLEALAENAASGDYVLGRTTAPLVQECLAMIRAGRKAIVRGRDIGKSLLVVLERIEKASRSGDKPHESIAAWGSMEIEKLTESNKPESMIAKVQDQIDTLQALAIGCTDMRCIKEKIDKVFSDEDEGTVFSTIHKAKGLEADRVFIIRPDLLPHPMAEQPWEKVQESNLKYVAITRAMKELVWVDGERSRDKKPAKAVEETPEDRGARLAGTWGDLPASELEIPDPKPINLMGGEAEMRRLEAEADRQGTIRDNLNKIRARGGR